MKDNLNFYFENNSQIILEDQFETKANFDSLISKGIFVSEDSKTWNIKERTSDIEKEDIRWFNIAILTQIYPNILVKRPFVSEITKVRYQSLLSPLVNLMGKEELTAAKAGLLLRVWDYKAIYALKAVCNSDNKILALRANGILLYFERLEDKKPHLDFIGKSLKDSNPKMREIATDMLILSIVPPEHNIPFIIEALALDERNSTRANASLYFAGETAIPYLEKAIHHENPKVAVKAMGVLARNSKNPEKYVPALGKAYKEGSYQIKIGAAKALEDIGFAAAPYLIPGLGGDRKLSHRTKLALQYIGTLGSRAKAAIPKLENLAKNDTRSVAVLAEEALKLIKKGY